MSDRLSPNLLARLVTGIVFIVGCFCAGAALGLLYVKLFVPGTGMGFDRLADALGGMMVGGVGGVATGAFLVWRLDLRRQWHGVAVTLAATALTFGGLLLAARNVERSHATAHLDAKESFQPFYRVRLRMSHTHEFLAEVPTDERPIPFTEAEVSTGKPELIHVGWGPDFIRCTGTPAEQDLELLVPRIKDVIAAEGPYCRAEDQALKLSASWNLAGETGNQGLDAGCLDAEHAAVRVLAETVNEISKRLCM